jgi:hypothetical protein
MSEYFHPATGKVMKIEMPEISGGVATVTETNNNSVQTLYVKESEIKNFIGNLAVNGWLLRQLL